MADDQLNVEQRQTTRCIRGLSRIKKGKLGANAMKRVAAGAHLPTPWLFEPAF